MSVRPITDTLRALQEGLYLDRCSDKLADLVKGVDETGKSGKLVLTLELKKSSGAISITAHVKASTPEPKPDSDLLWPTVEGNLTRDNPKQQQLELRQVEASKAAEARPVEALQAAVREVRQA